MNVFVGALLAVLVALPLQSVQEVRDALVGGSPAGECAGRAVVQLQLQTIMGEFVMYVSGRRFVLLDNSEGDQTPAWLGRIALDGKLIAEQQMEFSELEKRFPDTCEMFEEGV